MKTLCAFFEIPVAIATSAMALVLVLAGCATNYKSLGIMNPEVEIPVTKNIVLNECYYKYNWEPRTFEQERVPEVSLPQGEVKKAKGKIRKFITLLENEGYNVRLVTPPPNEVCEKGGEAREGVTTITAFLIFAPRFFLMFQSKTENKVNIVAAFKSPKLLYGRNDAFAASYVLKNILEVVEVSDLQTMAAHFKRQLELRRQRTTAGT